MNSDFSTLGSQKSRFLFVSGARWSGSGICLTRRLILSAAPITDHRESRWPACTRNPATAVLFCTRPQSGTDWRQQMQHVPHFTHNMSDGQKNKTKKNLQSESSSANPRRHANLQSHVLNVPYLRCANRRSEIWSSEHWQPHNPTLSCKSIWFDSLQKRLGMKNGHNCEF